MNPWPSCREGGCKCISRPPPLCVQHVCVHSGVVEGEGETRLSHFMTEAAKRRKKRQASGRPEKEEESEGATYANFPSPPSLSHLAHMSGRFLWPHPFPPLFQLSTPGRHPLCMNGRRNSSLETCRGIGRWLQRKRFNIRKCDGPGPAKTARNAWGQTGKGNALFNIVGGGGM